LWFLWLENGVLFLKMEQYAAYIAIRGVLLLILGKTRAVRGIQPYTRHTVLRFQIGGDGSLYVAYWPILVNFVFVNADMPDKDIPMVQAQRQEPVDQLLDIQYLQFAPRTDAYNRCQKFRKMSEGES
jgi:hypothetical protein